VLVLGRLVQAVGAGCGITLVRAIAQDVYGPSRVVKAIAYLTMAYTLGPMISPMIGGILVDALGWRSVFGFALAAGGVITLGAYLAVFESHPPQSVSRTTSGSIPESYLTLLRHPRFVAFVLQTGFCSGSFLVAATAESRTCEPRSVMSAFDPDQTFHMVLHRRYWPMPDSDHKISLFRRLNSSAGRHADWRCPELAAGVHLKSIAIGSRSQLRSS
jgi:hypothetical protein